MFVEGGLHPEQIKALRQMSLQRRLDLPWQESRVRALCAKAMIASNNPDWSEDQVEKRCATKFAMPEDNPLAIFAPGLNALGVPWMAVGSIASSAYGERAARWMSMWLPWWESKMPRVS